MNDATPDPTPTHYRLDGLAEPVEILVDRWGIPHIYAANADDLFFAQGFNAARDRLFQLDLWRRRGIGELAAAFGPSYVEQDRAARLLMYRGDMDAEWAAYGEDTKRIVTRFVAGVNAYIQWLEAHPEALPPEFVRCGHRPARWRPEDVVRPRLHGPSYNLVSETTRARVAAAGDVADDQVRQHLERGHTPTVPTGGEVDLPSDVLRDYLLVTRRIPVVNPDASSDGSNNWALAPWRTTTDRPLLASDPHRAFVTPSLRYIAHLSAPGLDVIGAGEPALPGIALGHNGTAAFGFTIFTIDTEDLYVCALDSEEFEVVRETVEVAGGEPRAVELLFSRFGPVLCTDQERGKAYVLRSTATEPGTAPYLGSLDYLGARSWPEFRAALSSWRSPGENHVYADTSGTIAWQAAGLAPRRRGYDGLLPVPGDDHHDWDGFLSLDELPGVVDPADGVVATANEFNVPETLPLPSYEWPDHSRQRRIGEVLSSREKHSLEDMQSLQT
ncbi:MAG TPA: penicillin acylase family protein, partial [Actinopolymorphaceae bacterium]